MYIRTHAHKCTHAESCICVFYAYFTDQSNAFLRIKYKSDLVQWEKKQILIIPDVSRFESET